MKGFEEYLSVRHAEGDDGVDSCRFEKRALEVRVFNFATRRDPERHVRNGGGYVFDCEPSTREVRAIQ